MKKFLLIALALISTLVAFGQSIEYPRFETDSNGQQICLITIAQAQALDNNSELLSLFEKLNSQMADYDSVCVKVNVIASQKLEISNLKKSLDNKDRQIDALQGEIAGYLKKIIILEGQVENRQQMIDLKDKQIRKMKTKMIFGGVGGGVAIIGLILGLVLVN